MWRHLARFLVVVFALAATTHANAAVDGSEVQRIFDDRDRATADFEQATRDARSPDDIRRALTAFADEMSDIADRLSAQDWEGPEETAFRDLVVTSHEAVAEDARRAANGEITFEEFVERVLTHQAAFDRERTAATATATDGGGSAPLGFMDSWPTPLNTWWFWLLVFVGPVGPLVFGIAWGAGKGAGALARLFRDRR